MFSSEAQTFLGKIREQKSVHQFLCSLFHLLLLISPVSLLCLHSLSSPDTLSFIKAINTRRKPGTDLFRSA